MSDGLPRSPFSSRPGPLRGLVRRAFRDPSVRPVARYRHAFAWRDDPPVVPEAALGRARLAIIIPTLATTDGEGGLQSCLEAIEGSLRVLEATPGAPSCMLIVVAQDRAGSEGARDRALERIERWWADAGRLPFTGISLSVASKVIALNAARAFVEANQIDALAWFDDDVIIESSCLPALWRDFSADRGGVYGARKVAVPDRSRFSALWAGSKNRREPVNRYPHGCAMLMSRAAFGEGIPPEYITDDHYFLFRYLEPESPAPLQRLRVVADAVVHVPTVNSPAIVLRRIHRNYRNLHRVLADLPAGTARYFWRELQFPGLRAPSSIREALAASTWLRFGGNLGKACFWGLITAEVLARGALRRPPESAWFSAPAPHSIRRDPARVAVDPSR
jgi:hypothetical protein